MLENESISSQCRHLVADFWGCRLPASEEGWLRVIREAVEAMGATLLGVDVHLFDPQGGTAIAMLAESHLAVHTWPERDYVAIDVFTCGSTVRPDVGIAVLRAELAPQRERLLQIARGDTLESEDVASTMVISSSAPLSPRDRGETECQSR